MHNFPLLRLSPKQDKRIRQGHVWIYSNEVHVKETPLTSFQAGDVVKVVNAQGQDFGLATVSPNNLICARLFGQHVLTLDLEFFENRLRLALELREKYFSAPYYRLIYGESDGLPGFIMDRFGDYYVVQANTSGADRLLPVFCEAVQKLLKPSGIWFDASTSSRKMENLDHESRLLLGEFPELIQLQENDCDFQVNAKTGQKTGWFYDHRLNRLFCQSQVSGKRVLDVFSYAGGWSIELARAGASEVLAIDASEKALALLEQNAVLNKLEHKVSTRAGDAFQVLKQLQQENARFDVIVLDPPAFIKRKKDIQEGVQAYRRLFEAGIRLLDDKGLFVAASCSMHFSKDELIKSVQMAARKNNRHAVLVHMGGAGPDHPLHPALPELDYLKAGFFEIGPAF